MPECQPAFLDPSSLQSHIPWSSFKQISEEDGLYSPESQGCGPAFCSAPSSQDPEAHHLMVTAAKAASDFPICCQFFVSTRSRGAPFLVGSVIICVGKLLLMHSTSVLDYLRAAVLSF